MCRNIKTLFNFAPTATDEEIKSRFAAVREETNWLQQAIQDKRGGLLLRSRRDREDLGASARLLETTAPPKDREEEGSQGESALSPHDSAGDRTDRRPTNQQVPMSVPGPPSYK